MRCPIALLFDICHVLTLDDDDVMHLNDKFKKCLKTPIFCSASFTPSSFLFLYAFVSFELVASEIQLCSFGEIIFAD